MVWQIDKMERKIIQFQVKQSDGTFKDAEREFPFQSVPDFKNGSGISKVLQNTISSHIDNVFKGLLIGNFYR